MSSRSPQPTTVAAVRTYAEALQAARVQHPPAATTPTTRNTATPRPAAASAPAPTPAQPLTLVRDTTPPKTVANAPIQVQVSGSRDTSYEATIITDTKRKRFRLLPAVGTALTGWFTNKQQARLDKKKPKYTVPKAEHRKGVVAKATSATGRIATSDHQEIVARLKAQKEGSGVPATAKTAPAPTITAPDQTPQWDSLVRETATPDSKAGASRVMADLVSAATPVDTEATPPPDPVSGRIQNISIVARPANRYEESLDDTIEADTETDDEAEDGTDTVFSVDNEPVEDSENFTTEEVLFDTSLAETDTAEVAPTALPATHFQPVPKVIMPDRITPTTPVVTPTPQATAAVLPSVIPSTDSPRLPSQWAVGRDDIANRKQAVAAGTVVPHRRYSSPLLPYLALAVFGCITIGTIGFFIVTGNSTTISIPAGTSTSTLPTLAGTPADLDPTAPTALLQTLSKTALFTAVGSHPPTADSQFVIPLHPTTGQPLSASDTLTLINRRLPADFVGNVTHIALGTVAGAPTIMLTVANEQIARGGLFAWERTMSNDLSPWFGAPVTSTSSDSLTNFTDITIAGGDARILTEDGMTRIVYRFTSPSTIIITTSDGTPSE